MKIYVATENNTKYDEYKRFMKNHELEKISFNVHEIQHHDPRVVVKYKTEFNFGMLQEPVLCDDIGLYLDGLNNFPGAYIKHVEESSDLEILYRMLPENAPKTARIITAIGYQDSDEDTQVVFGELAGTVIETPRGIGKNGSGFDKVFIPNGYSKTIAEMSMEEQDLISPRRRAVEKLVI